MHDDDHGRAASDAVEARLDRVAALDAAEAGRIFVRFDAERVRAAAAAVDARPGDLPLRATTISIKDLFDETGEVTTAGSVHLAAAAPATADAPVVARLAAAGAVAFGRTNMTEFAYSAIGMNPHYGTPGNVADRARIPGGSTSGGAVGVARGLSDAALGSDTGGSVRIPAALNGIAGFKPTQRSVPLEGAFPLSATYDSIGPLARSIALCADIHAVLSATARPRRRFQDLSGVRVGVIGPLVTDDLDSRVGADYEAVLSRLAAAGAELRDVTVPLIAEAPFVNRTIVASDAHAVHASRLEALERDGDPRILGRIRFAEGLSGDDIAQARAVRAEARAAFPRIAGEVDVLIAPTIAIVAPTVAEAEADFDRLNGLILRNPSAVNFLDGCAATVPMNEPGALGTGAMLVGPSGADWRVLEIAELVEALLAAR